MSDRRLIALTDAARLARRRLERRTRAPDAARRDRRGGPAAKATAATRTASQGERAQTPQERGARRGRLPG
jgi:hypothetical protein